MLIWDYYWNGPQATRKAVAPLPGGLLAIREQILVRFELHLAGNIMGQDEIDMSVKGKNLLQKVLKWENIIEVKCISICI